MNLKRKTILIFVVLQILIVSEIEAKRGVAIARRKSSSSKAFNSRRGRGQDHGDSDGREGLGYGHIDRRTAELYEPIPYRQKRSASPQLDDWIGMTWDPKVYKPLGSPNIGSLKGIPSSYGQSIDDVQSYSGRYVGNYGAYTYGYPRNYLEIRKSVLPEESPIPLEDPPITDSILREELHKLAHRPHNTWNIAGPYGHGFGYGNSLIPYTQPKDDILKTLALWRNARGYVAFPSQHRVHIPLEDVSSGHSESESFEAEAEGLLSDESVEDTTSS